MPKPAHIENRGQCSKEQPGQPGMENAPVMGEVMENVGAAKADGQERGGPDQPHLGDGIFVANIEQHSEGDNDAKAREQQLRGPRVAKIDIGQDGADRASDGERHDICGWHHAGSQSERGEGAAANDADGEMGGEIGHGACLLYA